MPGMEGHSNDIVFCYHSNQQCTSHDHYTKHVTVRPTLVKEHFNSSAVGMYSILCVRVRARACIMSVYTGI